MKKITKVLLSGSLIFSISILGIFSVISCSDNKTNNNNNNTKNTNSTKQDTNKNNSTDNKPNNSNPGDNKPDKITNANNALPLGSKIKNGNLSNLSVAWNNEKIKGTVNLNSNYEISLNTNAPKDSSFIWYIANNSNELVSLATNFNTTQQPTTKLPSNIINSHHANDIYYVFCLISNNGSTYMVQTSLVALTFPTTNENNNYYLEITNGTVTKNNQQYILSGTQLTIDINQPPILPAVPSGWGNVDDYYTTYYNWSFNVNGLGEVSFASTGGVGNGESSGIAITYNASSIGYVTIYCNIQITNSQSQTQTINLSYTFLVNSWGDLSISNPNMQQNNLTLTSINDNSAVLTSNLTNSFLGSNLTYQWYVQNAQDLNNSANYWQPIPKATSANYMINNVLPSYSANYKLVVSSNNTTEVLESNIITVYYDSSLGSISLSYGNSANSDNIYTATNGETIKLSINTTKLNIQAPYVLFQWQSLNNGVWSNISNANSTKYSFVQTNNDITQLRVEAYVNNNLNILPIYTNTLIIQPKALSENILNKIETDATNWLNNNDNLQSMFYSYFSNNSTEFNWLETSMTSGFHYGANFETKINNEYVALNSSNFNQYVKFSGVSIVNGTANLDANKIKGSPNLEFYFNVISSNTYLYVNKKYLNIPLNTEVMFNSPFYLKDETVYGNQISTMPIVTFASNGQIQYEVSAPGMQSDAQAKVSWYWEQPWGVTFSQSFLNTLTASGYFSEAQQRYHSSTYLNFNWLSGISGNSNNTLVITSNNTPAIPNFLAEITTGNVSIATNQNPATSLSNPYSFTNSDLTLSPNPYLSNDGQTNFSYSWYSQKTNNWNINNDWTNLNDTNSTYLINYPSNVSFDYYDMVYKCEITTTYNGVILTKTIYFYIEYISQTSNRYQNKIPTKTSEIILFKNNKY